VRNLQEAAFLAGTALTGVGTGLTGSSSLELSLLELDESPALLFFLRLFLGFLFRVLVLATAGAAVDAAGGSVADIADTNQLFGIDMTVVKGLSGRRCPTS
jgi:hypothetical protein